MRTTLARGRLRPTSPLLLAAALYTLAGGWVHLREWLDVYRDVPATIPGAALVRIGFPLDAGLSLVLGAALVFCALRRSRLTPAVAAATGFMQAGSLAVLIGTRVGTVFGWTEPAWTRGAEQSRAVETGALLMLAAALAVAVRLGRPERLGGVHPGAVSATA